MAVETMPAALAGERPLSTQEKMQRSDATACINRTTSAVVCCVQSSIVSFSGWG